ncbi:MAG: ABC transporter permease, partial [Anaerolineaceae bacterium]
MLSRIAAFEVRYQLRAPLFAIGFALFFLLTYGAVTTDGIQIGAAGNVNVNSPYAIAQTMAIMGVFGMFIVAAFVSNVIVRDDETGVAPLVQSTRITKADYLVGRFAGAGLVAFLVLASVPLGMLVGSWMPWLDQEKVGPFIASHYLYALFVIGLPTLFVMAAGLFALATLTRSMMWTYVGLIAFLVLFVTSRVLLRDPAYDTIASLSDPFGVTALQRGTRYWTATDRNTMLPPFAGLMLYNRLIWVAVGFAFFAVAFWRFRFAMAGAAMGKAIAASKAVAAPITRRVDSRKLAAPTPASGWRQFLALTRFDMRFVFKSPAFFVLLAVGVFNTFGGMLLIVTQRGVDYFPVTRALVEVLVGAFSIIPIIIAVYYAGELVWRDHDRRMHEIVGATAAPDWAFVLPKILAIAGVLACTYLAAVATAVGFQLWHGYTRVELGNYLLWFVAPGVVVSLLLAVLSVFVQVLVPQKFIGWAAMLVYLVATVSLAAAGFEPNLSSYAGPPLVPISDMNGLGRFWIGQAWFLAYWSSFALVLAVLTYCLWRRGAEMRLAPRLRRLRLRLAGRPGVILAAGLAGWIGIGAFIFWNTNVLNRYLTVKQQEAVLADYEKALLAYETVPQPRITDVKLTVDLFPREARAVTRGEYAIENRTGAALPGVHVRWNLDSRLAMTELDVEGARIEKEFADFHYRIYRFDVPMQPGERRTVRFASVLEEKGFPNARALTHIVANGSFLNNSEVSPGLGMDRRQLLSDRS